MTDPLKIWAQPETNALSLCGLTLLRTQRKINVSPFGDQQSLGHSSLFWDITPRGPFNSQPTFRWDLLPSASGLKGKSKKSKAIPITGLEGL
jgi:hypothetical protein